MPQLKTPNNLYKFMTAKLCHPMRIRVEDLTHWSVNDWYGAYTAKHIYYIAKYMDRMTIRYEGEYWFTEVINKYGKDSQLNRRTIPAYCRNSA